MKLSRFSSISQSDPSKEPIAESSTHRKMSLRTLDLSFRWASEAQIDRSKYPSENRLGILITTSSLFEIRSGDEVKRPSKGGYAND